MKKKYKWSIISWALKMSKITNYCIRRSINIPFICCFNECPTIHNPSMPQNPLLSAQPWSRIDPSIILSVCVINPDLSQHRRTDNLLVQRARGDSLCLAWVVVSLKKTAHLTSSMWHQATPLSPPLIPHSQVPPYSKTTHCYWHRYFFSMPGIMPTSPTTMLSAL